MYPYLIFIVIIFIANIIDCFVRNKKVSLICFCSIILSYFFIAVFKGINVGLDTKNYYDSYNSAKEFTFFAYLNKNKPEFLFYGLMYVFKVIFKLPFFAFSFLCYLIISIFLFLIFYKEKGRVFYISVFFAIGYFCFSFSGLRQAIAIVISSFAVTILINKQYTLLKQMLVYYGLIFISFLFHSSAIIFAFVPILFKLKINFDIFNIALIIMLLFMPSLSNGLWYLFVNSVNIYYRFDVSRISFLFIFCLITILIYTVLYKYNSMPYHFNEKIKFSFEDDIDKTTKYILLGLCFCFFTSFNQLTTVFTRFSLYFIIYFPHIIFKFISSNNYKFNTTLRLISIPLFCFYMIYSLPTLGLLPYVN